jgi:light-regulated signal transduction histidine kinase (bacteriophytochrome)
MNTLLTDVQLPKPETAGPVDAPTNGPATVDVLEDFSDERSRLEDTQKAVLNILEDFSDERSRLEDTQKAVLNILEDFDLERENVDRANEGLRDEVVERNRVEHVLREKTGELARSNAELEMFAYVASHDLQEPLRMITSYTQLLAKRYGKQLDKEADEFIAYVVDGTTRMQALLQDLLKYSRVGAGELALRAIDCEQVLADALANLAALREESGAIVTHGPLPCVLGDHVRLTQLFQNLVANAIKFRAAESPVVSVTAEVTDEGWQLSVRDNGIGIQPVHADRVFEAFQRLHSREYTGTGIGLAICKKIVERHGGRIWVESELGEGSNFCFTLQNTAQS